MMAHTDLHVYQSIIMSHSRFFFFIVIFLLDKWHLVLPQVFLISGESSSPEECLYWDLDGISDFCGFGIDSGIPVSCLASDRAEGFCQCSGMGY